MSDWYYAVNNEQKGPVNESELKAQFAARQLSPDGTLVWKDGMENWTPASQIAAFSFREPPPPATRGMLSPTPASVARTPGANNPQSAMPLSVASLLGPGEALEVDAEDAENNKIFGILAYLGILCLVPLFAAKTSPFARYHANQGLVLFLVEIALAILLQIIDMILAVVGIPLLSVFLSLLWLGVIALLILGIVNAAAGKCVPLPVIGKFQLIK